MELRQRCLAAFRVSDPDLKISAVLEMGRGSFPLPDAELLLSTDAQPGRPASPELVQPQNVPQRSPYTLKGHCAMVHAITHIEFNAINLALDAVWRFPHMPLAYYRDWLGVAVEESRHFTLLRNHLREHGQDYGDHVAHDGLWTMCENTRHDVTTRMALVPRTLEARGLDATPIIQSKLRKVGTPSALAASAILDTILLEEVGHVAIGNHWYNWLCERNQFDPLKFYSQVASQYNAPKLKPPFNLDARRRAGFTEAEISALQVHDSHTSLRASELQ